MLTFDPLSTFDPARTIVAWVIVMAVLGIVAILLGFTSSLLANGAQGPQMFARRVGDFFGDWFSTSPRRIFAVAKLTILQAFRGKIVYVGVIFALLYLFAGWFTTNVGTDADGALKVYVGFVLRSISWIPILVLVIMACWGLPEDIRLRSIHTVVTKPIRRHEIVLGRIVGYSLVGIAAMFVMSTVGYVWILRQLPPAARAQLEAKVPVYGEISFRDREGVATSAGINVGDEDQFFSFIEGNTKARAIWDFDHAPWAERKDRDALVVSGKIAPGDRLEMTLGNARLSVTAKSDDLATAAADVAAAWNAADPKTHPAFADVTATASGNTVQLVPKKPGASLAVQTAFIPADAGSVAVGDFTTQPILLEANFRAFRTWKGNIDRGLLCQFIVSKEYGVLTLPEKVAAGTLKLGKGLDVKIPAGDARQASDAIIAAMKKASPTTEYPRLETELWVPKTAEEGTGARLLLRGRPNDLLPKMEVSGIDGVKYEFIRVEGHAREFEIREFRRNEYNLQRALTDKDGKPVDLYRDLLDGTRLRIEARCLSGGQLLGMARPHLIVRLPSHTFLETYAKACSAITLALCTLITLGVCASTFVKGPFALFLVAFMAAVGTRAREFVEFLGKDQDVGGGALEGAYRIFYHLNPTSPIEPTAWLTIARTIDNAGKGAVWSLQYAVPDFRIFFLDKYVANAFDIPWLTSMLPCLLVALGVAIPWIILAHFSMMVRELEHK